MGKRIQGILNGRLSQVEQAMLKEAASLAWDYGFWITQLHTCWIAGSFFMWNRSGATGDIGEDSSSDGSKETPRGQKSTTASKKPRPRNPTGTFGTMTERPAAKSGGAPLAPQRQTPFGPLRVNPRQSEETEKQASTNTDTPRRKGRQSPATTPRGFTPARTTLGSKSPRSARGGSRSPRPIKNG